MDVHVDFYGFEAGGVVFEQAQLGVDAVGGGEGDHVGLEVGHDEGEAGVVDEGDKVDDFVDVAFGVLGEALALDLAGFSSDGVGLYTGFEVFEGVGAEIAFDGVVFVGGAFCAPSGLFSFCHDGMGYWG